MANVKKTKTVKTEPRTLTAAQIELFDKLMEREEEKDARAKAARVRLEKIKANEESRPDQDEETAELLWEEAAVGTFVRIWLPEYGRLNGLVIRDFDVFYRKGEKKGELARAEKHIYLDEAVLLGDESETTLVAAEEGQIVTIGTTLKFPKLT